MSFRSRVTALWRNLMRRDRVERDLDDELRATFELLVDEKIRAGLPPDDARRAAAIQLGGVEGVKERVRDVRQGAFMDVLLQDLRYAVRMLRRRPAFTLAAMLTLALGLGANITIFSLTHAVLLRSLPVERPAELYRLGDTNNCCVNSGLQDSYSLYSFRLFEHLREATVDVFVEVAGFQANTQPVAVRRGDGASDSLQGQYVSSTYFRMLGVRPATGRLLVPEDDRPGADPVVVLSHRVWAERYGGDPSLVGSPIVVNGHPMTVVGVAARGFFGETIRPNPASIWIPLGQEPALRGAASLIERAGQDWLYAIGRLRPGVSPEQVGTQATTALRQWLEAQPFLSEQDRSRLPRQHIVVVPAGGGVPLLRAQFGQALTILLVTSGLVLLIASANLANLMLSRADRGQVAIRAALGASTGRLVRQHLTEGVLLALAGGLIAVWVSAIGARVLVALAFPSALVDYVPIEATPTSAVWLFAITLAVVTGVLFSAGPAWAMSRTQPIGALAGAGRSGRFQSFVPRRSLVVAQVALSFVLLTGAGLLASSLGNLEAQKLGFEPDERTVVHINPPAALAGERLRLARLYAAMRDRLLRIPGVRDVSYALYSPMQADNWSSGVYIAGRPADPASPNTSSWNRVGPRYFETIGTPLLRGRLIAESEVAGGARVAVVNDAFRRRFFENAEPIGQRVGIMGPEHAEDYEIVGVVEDVRYTAPREAVRPMVFFPAFQAVEYVGAAASVQSRSMLLRTLIVRAAAGPGILEAEIRRALAEVERDVTVIRVVPHAEQVSANFRTERLMARLTSLYGALALVLAAVGLYGVTAFGVAQRTREIGVRMALGADRSRIARAVVRGPVVQTVIGLSLGVPLGIAASRSITTQLYGVDSEDPIAFGAAAGVLLATTVIAAIFPAVRAASIDPAQALRIE